MRAYWLLFLLLLITSCANRKSELKLISREFGFTEGPAADAEGNVFFTDQPNNRIMRWDATTGQVDTFMQPSGRANGLYLDSSGKLLAAADEKFELWSIGPDKKVEILLDNFGGRSFNGPNDIWVHPEGAIYFTDPYYQRPYWERLEGDLQREQVFRYVPASQTLEVVEKELVKPNGIIGSPDGSLLYVADIGDDKTYRYTIEKDGSLSHKTLFYPMGSDGMTIDKKGRVYLTGDGVTIVNPDGSKHRHIEVPEPWTANVTFGGKNRDILFITASKGVYMIRMPDKLK